MSFGLDHTVGTIAKFNQGVFETTYEEIKDANNNVLWRSSKNYPYTKYEYFYSHSYTSGYIKIPNFNQSTSLVYYNFTFKIDALPDSTHTRFSYLATYDARKANDLRRLYILIVDQTGIRCCLGNTWYTAVATANINIDHWYKVVCSVSQSSNKAKINWYLYDVTNNNTQVASTVITNTVTGYCGLSATNTYLGCSAAADSSGNVTYSEYIYGKIGEIQIRQTNSSGAYVHHIFPAYKRPWRTYSPSDFEAGAYIARDTTTNASSSTTMSVSGNVKEEYWDGN